MKRIYYSFLILLIVSNSAFSQPTIKAVRIGHPPQIDGHVNEAVWQEAFVVDDFYQREPNEGAPVSKKTEFLVFYDSDFIYFGFK